jgi:hypothetical protein
MVQIGLLLGSQHRQGGAPRFAEQVDFFFVKTLMKIICLIRMIFSYKCRAIWQACGELLNGVERSRTIALRGFMNRIMVHARGCIPVRPRCRQFLQQ